MSVNNECESELKKTIGIPSTNTGTMVEENLPFLKMTVKDSSHNVALKGTNTTSASTTLTYGPKFSASAQNSVVSSSQDKKKVEKTHSGPVAASRIPSFRLSTPNSQGYTRVSYSNEKKQENKRSEKQSSPTSPQKRESSSIFSRQSKSSAKHSPLLRLNREEKKIIQTSNKTPVEHHFNRSRNLSPDDVNRVRSIGALRNFRGGGLFPLRLMERPTQHHSFPTDDTDVREIEKKLLQLMEDFEAGNLRAFGKDSRLHQMEEIREQQEKLAKLHFEVGADQELYSPLSEDGLKNAEDNMKKLMNKLAHLSESIENLHSNSHLERRASNTDRSVSIYGIHPLSTPSSVESANLCSQYDSSTNPISAPSVPHHNPNKVGHSPPLPPLPTAYPLQNTGTKIKEQKLSSSHYSNKPVSASNPKKSTTKLPTEDNSSQLLHSSAATNITQQKLTYSAAPVSFNTTNVNPSKYVS